MNVNHMTGEEMKPSIGRIVHYKLSAVDVGAITRRRTSSDSIISRMNANPPAWPAGAQAHMGNPVAEGDVYPAIIVRVWADQESPAAKPTQEQKPPFVQLQVFLDGTDIYWASSRCEGDDPGSWAWPKRD